MQLRPEIHRWIAFALVVPFLAACEVEPDPDALQEAPPAEEPDPDAPPPDAQMEHAVVPLQPMGDSDVMGEAMLMEEADALVVVVDVTGLPGEGDFPSHIHEGTCDDPGGVAEPLSDVIGLEDGTGSSTSTIDLGALDPGGQYLIMVHAEDGAPIACGELDAGM